MSNLNLTAQWHNNINQVDVTEPIVGGDGGNANLATRQLAENILWLKQQIGSVEAYKIGDIYTTTINHVSADAVATHHGYGTWVRYGEGRALVGQSTKAADPDDYKTIGKMFGENEHTLTVEEMPDHTHAIDFHSGNISGHTRPSTASKSATAANMTTGSSGSNMPHNNIQPSIVVGHWLRTA